jgi:hypothetical protein
MTEEMIGRNHHKEKKINFHSIGVLLMFVLIMERRIDNSCPLTFILSPKMGERGG